MFGRELLLSRVTSDGGLQHTYVIVKRITFNKILINKQLKLSEFELYKYKHFHAGDVHYFYRDGHFFLTRGCRNLIRYDNVLLTSEEKLASAPSHNRLLTCNLWSYE